MGIINRTIILRRTLWVCSTPHSARERALEVTQNYLHNSEILLLAGSDGLSITRIPRFLVFVSFSVFCLLMGPFQLHLLLVLNITLQQLTEFPNICVYFLIIICNGSKIIIFTSDIIACGKFTDLDCSVRFLIIS